VSHPQYLYYAAVIAMALVELLRRRSFGPVIWIVEAVFVVSLTACNLGFPMPGIKLVLHAAAFIAGLMIASRPSDQVVASVFLPMGTVDLLCVKEMASEYTWWWSLYYLAFAQLFILALASELHPIGRWIKRTAETAWLHMEKRMVVFA